MSQIQRRRNVSQLESVKFGDTVPSISVRSACPDLLNSISEPLIRGNRTQQREYPNSPSKVKPQLIESPIQLREQFRSSFRRISTSSQITTQKSDTIQLIKSLPYRVNSSQVVARNIQAIHSSQDRATFEQAVEKTMQHIQSEHTAVFAEHVSSVVRTAATKVGFTLVSVSKNPTTINIISQNDQGQAIVSQIDTDPKSAQVDIATETVGFKGNSCETVLQKFDMELEKAGLKHKPNSVKWTGDNSFLPLAKTAKKKLMKKPAKKAQKKQNTSNDRARRIHKRNNLLN